MKKLVFRTIPVALLMAAVLSAPGYSAEITPPQRTIVVTGEGEVLAKPDQARMTAAVVTQAPTAQAAAEENATAMTRVMSALSMLGIPPNKIQTSNYSIQPQYAPLSAATGGGQRNITGYQAINQVTVTVDDLSKLGSISDTLVRSGANQVGGISFSIADPKPLAERARTAAVNDAMAKARTLAAAAGVRLGPMLNLQEGPSAIRPGPFFAARALEAAPPTPVSIGEEPIIVGVTMTFGIQ
jgi:uncharacterized protein YggE